MNEQKTLSQEDYNDIHNLSRVKRKHKEKEIIIERDSESYFKLIIRSSTINPLDFSVILSIGYYKSNQQFKIRRYNGKSHSHKNKIEDHQFYDFHIHHATERYQRLGMKEETYATISDKYSDISSAIELCLKECNFIIPSGTNQRLSY